MTSTPDLSPIGARGDSRVNPAQIDIDDDPRGAPSSLATRDAVEQALSDFDDFEDLDIELVVFDMAGTTVQDDGLVERAFVLAAQRSGIAATETALEEALAYVRETMGQSKIDVFRELTDTEAEAHKANAAFETAYGELIARVGVSGIEGAEDLFQELRDAGVKIALTTGFSRATQDALIDSLGWANLIDLSLSPSEAGRGRPHPDLPLTALLRMGVSSVAALVVVGDTASDMLSGTSAGAGLVVGVRTGTHDSETLEAAGADVVIDSVADLAELLGLRAEFIH
ncbi:phosphonatase-like hydrolase [Cryobacterium roopkundense]|uniref:Phosphonatase-like hydrolase n=2 Tax=Cryobacterium roopkundense TaxID=1001240 RepID=A0A7W8ZZ92_9MICO|nr:phosphonatase-like hydrolase [Cryobacterium roopkundense]MBB5642941.1 phosphonatase-like hydrolase [Cryobacterium roopkundense]